MDIKKVEIGCLKNPKITSIVQNNMFVYKLKKEVLDEKICFVIGDKAIDINDFNNVYIILKKNNYNQILPEQNIKEGLVYGLKVKDLTKEDLSLLKKIDYKKKAKQYIKINR